MARDTAYGRSLRRDRRLADFLRRTPQLPRSSCAVCGGPPSPIDDLEAPASRCPMRGASRRTALLGRSKKRSRPGLFWAPLQALANPAKRAGRALKKAPVPRRLKKSRFNPLIHGRHSERQRGAPQFAPWPLLRARQPSLSPARQTTPMKRQSADGPLPMPLRTAVKQPSNASRWGHRFCLA